MREKRIIKSNRLISILLALIMVLGMAMMFGMAPSIQVEAAGDQYRGYKDDGQGSGKFDLYVMKDGGTKDPKSDEIVYCYNAGLGEPNAGGNYHLHTRIIADANTFQNSVSFVPKQTIGPVNSMPDIEKYRDSLKLTDDAKIVEGKTYSNGAKDYIIYDYKSRLRGEELRNAVLKVVYNGYNSHTKRSALQTKLGVSDADMRLATQAAVWYFTDSMDKSALSSTHLGYLSGGASKAYDILININSPELESVPDNATLNIFKLNARNLGPVIVEGKNGDDFQHLLGGTFVDKKTGVPIDIKTVSSSVSKVWKDSKGQDLEENKKQPVTLYVVEAPSREEANKKTVDDAIAKVTLEGPNWNHTFNELPKLTNGNKYFVNEVKVEGFTTEITGNDTDGFTVINKEDAPISGEIKVTKTWAGAELKEGETRPEVYFQLMKEGLKEGSPVKLEGTEVVFKIEDKKDISKYTVEEVNADGTPWKSKGFKAGDVTGSNGEFRVENTKLPEKEKTQVTFSKKALTKDGEELKGARIKLTKKDGTVVKEWITDGKLTEFELEEGSYTFTEVSAPDKYQIATAITFEVKDGKVLVTGTEVKGNTIVMVDKLKEVPKTQVTFSKKALTKDGEELEGARIKLTKKDGTVVKEWTTDGKLTEFELEEGSYTFTEVSAPDKYQVATAITFEVKDGKVLVTGTEVKGNTIVMVDKLKEVPKTPAKPKTPVKTKEIIKKDNKTPNTGDGFNPGLYTTVIAFAGVGITLLGIKRRRETENK